MNSETPQNAKAPVPVVYVIEDDDVQRRGLARFLSREGFEVLEFADGESAINSLAPRGSRPPDVIICDYRLPGKNGLEVITAAIEILPGSVCILISAYLTPRITREMRSLGVFAILEKPLKMDLLFSECRSALSA